MQTLAEAQQRVLEAVTPLPAEVVPTSKAAGRFLAERIQAGFDLPSFNNSAMDGYAVRSSDLATACPENPVALQRLGRVEAGQTAPDELGAGGCIRIFTGSPLPPGADAVIMQEDTRVAPDRTEQVLMLDKVNSGENIRFKGEDVEKGKVVLEPGHRIWAGSLAMLSSLGLAQVSVGRRPAVGLLATGNELQNPGEPLSAGHIYESNRLSLAAMLAAAGGNPRLFALVDDKLSDVRSRLGEAFAVCDCVVSTGGVSVGEMDLVKAAFTEMGGQIDFWRVAMKPGKPFLFGRWQDKLFFGLPGNPVSAFVTCALLVRPAILRWQGASNWALERQWVKLAQPLHNDGDRTHFLRMTINEAGEAALAGKQASHMISSLASAHGLLEMEPGRDYPGGAVVSVLRMSD